MIFHKSDKESIDECSKILKKGGIVIIPTDTVYGFSGIVSDQFKTDEKIRAVKGRSENKPLIQLIVNPSDLSKYTDQQVPQNLLAYWPGPLTIIVKQKNSETTTAFRCPGDKWLRDVIELCDAPVYSTSVNKSGCPVLTKEEDIVSVFGKDVDLIVLNGDTGDSLPSTIVKLVDGGYEVIRKGAIEL